MDKAQQAFFKRIGAVVRRHRITRNLTLEDMQDYAFSPQHFQKIEAGKKAISLYTAYRIAKAFKLNLADFLKESP